MQVGDEFGSMDAFRVALRDLEIQERHTMILKESNDRRIVAVCPSVLAPLPSSVIGPDIPTAAAAVSSSIDFDIFLHDNLETALNNASTASTNPELSLAVPEATSGGDSTASHSDETSNDDPSCTFNICGSIQQA